MIVCSCHAVSDSALRNLAQAGATVEEVERLTAAGTSCGCCREDVIVMVQAAHGPCKSTPCEGCPRRAAVAA